METCLEFTSLCVHWEFIEVHGAHEPDARGNHVQHLPLLRHPQPLQLVQHGEATEKRISNLILDSMNQNIPDKLTRWYDSSTQDSWSLVITSHFTLCQEN